MEAKDVHTAVIAVMEQVGYVQKEKGKNLNYTYAGEAALISAIRPHMIANGLFLYPLQVNAIDRSEYSTKSGTSMTNTVTQVTYRFVHAPSNTFFDVQVVGEGSDAGDKGANKALTGAYKYALRQTFCIETGDDPDNSPSESQERKNGTTRTPREPQPAQPKPEKRPAQSGGPFNAVQWLQDEGLADNANNAASIATLYMAGRKGMDEAEFKPWARSYRGWRDAGLNSDVAVMKANGGETPK